MSSVDASSALRVLSCGYEWGGVGARPNASVSGYSPPYSTTGGEPLDTILRAGLS